MVPSFRGGNDNPGHREALLGEVDDALAASAWLTNLDYVDPDRMYLAGHSTGGTLALLVAEVTDRFRAVVAFGPVGNIGSYDTLPFDRTDEDEVRLRSPLAFLHAITTPTFVIEGAQRGNAASARRLAREASVVGAPIRTYVLPGFDHFSVLAAVTPIVARKMMATEAFALSDDELAAAR